ncbi:hypothetical protein HPB48_018781 [Haemaphysalis longicornis]|uniref:Uncharacterized protein n=1 Tax=Haemaphysalis longicornis TaxID=44386 RepID=A0A9J6G2Q6_HAELO|nr:hypothetical protein HPB48_018781 [Haemaphysalis longicornis]
MGNKGAFITMNGGDMKPKFTTYEAVRTLPWSSFLLHWALQLGTQALAVCDYLGEHLANWFGITAPKYRYEIEHGRDDDDDETVESGWQRSETIQVTARQPGQLPGPAN